MSTQNAVIENGHAPVRGISMYYEVHGRREGIPLVLLHGGGSTIEVTYGRLLPFLSADRRIIAVEEQGHGRTTDRDAPVTFESSADDVAALLQYLEIEQADVMGFSNGASVALQVAIRHPQLVRKLIFASSLTRRDGAPREFWEFMKNADFSNMPQPLKDAFLKVNPDTQKLRTMHDKDAARMRSFSDVPDALVASVRAPTLIINGDHDVATTEHVAQMARLIPGARLLVLPGGHGEYLGERVVTDRESRYPELTAGLIREFLEDTIVTQPKGFLAVPPSNSGSPVLVLHAWWGLNDTMKDVCRRLAEAGFVAYAPDLFHGRVANTIAAAESLIGAVENEQVRKDVREAASFVRQRARTKDLAVVGFSFGAAYALDLSASDPDVRSVVIFYGTGPANFSRSKAEYLAHFAENDPYEPPSNIEQLTEALKKTGRPAEFHRYPGTGHWFFEPDRTDAYRKDAAELAWQRTLAFLRSQGTR